MPGSNKISKFGFIFMAILFILLPFHAFITTFLTSVLTSTTQDSLSIFSVLIASWKEILMSLMIITILGNSIFNKKLPFKPLLIDFFIILLLAWALLSSIFQSDTFIQGLVGIRFDFEFFILYWIIRSFTISREQITKLLKFLLIVTTVVIIAGFIQMHLSCETLTYFGYTPYVSSWVSSKPLPCGHGIGENTNVLRMMSTFSGPNQLASYLIMVIMLSWFLLSRHLNKFKEHIFTKYSYMAFIAIAITALFFTYSRGAMLALLAAFVSLLVLQASDSKKTFGYIVLGIVISILVFTLNVFISPSRYQSTIEHFQKPIEGLILITEKPWGYGVGMAGPASMRFPADGSKAIISENWYLQVTQEFGILGGFMFFLLLSFALRYLYQKQSKLTNPEDKELVITILAIYMGLLTNNLFMHTWSSDMVTSLIFWSLFAYAVQIPNEGEKKSQ